jgi:ribose transport system substrate-binding protein
MKRSYWMLSLVVVGSAAARGLRRNHAAHCCAGTGPCRPKTLGLVLSTLNNPFFVTLRDGAQHAADEANVKLIVVDAQDDSAKMTAGIEDLIKQEGQRAADQPDRRRRGGTGDQEGE